MVLLAAGLLPGQVKYEDILKGPGRNWLTYAGDYAATRYSPLSQIHTGNVGSLVPKWTFQVPGARRLEASPLVHEGVMYITNTNEVLALDAASGRRIWTYRDEQAKLKNVNRGVALLGNRVYFVTSDCHLVALDARTGRLVFHKKYADTEKGNFATLAPLAIQDKILVGVSGGESGMRGFVAALSAGTGEEVWRTYTVPLKGEPFAETWSEFDTQWAGAATWMSGTFDPALNLVYWTTGNPWPDFYGGERRGDNLFSCSVLALDAGTGRMKWYFQFTPHDTHDWDAQSWPVLVDLEWKGQPRKLLMHPNRNGFFYLLDRVTGEFLRATPFIDKLTWATGVDAKGRPIEVSGSEPKPEGNITCPSVRGASNWMSPTFHPATRLFYVPTLEQCDRYFSSARKAEPLKGFTGGGGEEIPNQPGQFFLRALDPITGRRVWQYPMTGKGDMWAGAVSTAGGLVVFGDDDGQIVALDARTGRHLWHYAMGQLLTASPVTFEVNGKQYITLLGASDVFTFGLFEPAKPVGRSPDAAEAGR
jgi:alcohol dehydrogenase (cytochrome c)